MDWILDDLDGHLKYDKISYGDKRNIQDIVEIQKELEKLRYVPFMWLGKQIPAKGPVCVDQMKWE